jgi:hypothetical protein
MYSHTHIRKFRLDRWAAGSDFVYSTDNKFDAEEIVVVPRWEFLCVCLLCWNYGSFISLWMYIYVYGQLYFQSRIIHTGFLCVCRLSWNHGSFTLLSWMCLCIYSQLYSQRSIIHITVQGYSYMHVVIDWFFQDLSYYSYGHIYIHIYIYIHIKLMYGPEVSSWWFLICVPSESKLYISIGVLVYIYGQLYFILCT